MMGVNKYNSEKYLDLTAYEAISRIEREAKRQPFRPLVFISSPFSGDVKNNTIRTRRYCRYAVDKGAIPIAPHLFYPQFMNDNDKAERSLGIFFGLVLMDKCDELWVFGSNISKGMKIELAKAISRGLTIKYFIENGGDINEQHS